MISLLTQGKAVARVVGTALVLVLALPATSINATTAYTRLRRRKASLLAVKTDLAVVTKLATVVSGASGVWKCQRNFLLIGVLHQLGLYKLHWEALGQAQQAEPGRQEQHEPYMFQSKQPCEPSTQLAHLVLGAQ